MLKVTSTSFKGTSNIRIHHSGHFTILNDSSANLEISKRIDSYKIDRKKLIKVGLVVSDRELIVFVITCYIILATKLP